MLSQPTIFLVSACLIGLCSRYDGKTRPNKVCQQRLQNGIWIPFCPEQMGGLPTPRTAADIIEGDGNDVLSGKARVLTRDGIDVSPQFIKGAEQTLLLAKSQQVTSICLKSSSPSCGISGKIGVTAALLNKHGFHLTEF
ncbi:MAG: DUF523 domain-containing protein [Proteobacteria bacterium]|nr:DUF523 domain-containing protein [Desulfocapsa sp.]MBU3946464.1 DUF523 domain-containing protein [Pseudomonadota bacterium]MBU3982394.1 DUF523 domain-containing protein [Pseudomonadota bacterium]MBU4028308.1 DUF523 domain-containing protein [Pseudomonadota bacterium]MBU4044132.1 DUF523 domain-containing protein [Pseudomonadota bacterium]